MPMQEMSIPLPKDAKRFDRAVKAVLPHTSKHKADADWKLRVRLSWKPDDPEQTMRLAATDGYRYILADYGDQNCEPTDDSTVVYVNPANLQDMVKTVKVNCDLPGIQYGSMPADTSMDAIRRLEEQVPYAQHSEQIALTRKTFLEAVSYIPKDMYCRIIIEGKKVSVYAEEGADDRFGSGAFKRSIRTEYTDDMLKSDTDVQIAFNPAYVMQAVRPMKTEAIELGYTNRTSQATFYEGDLLTAVIMPIFLRW